MSVSCVRYLSIKVFLIDSSLTSPNILFNVLVLSLFCNLVTISSFSFLASCSSANCFLNNSSSSSFELSCLTSSFGGTLELTCGTSCTCTLIISLFVFKDNRELIIEAALLSSISHRPAANDLLQETTSPLQYLLTTAS